MSSSPDYSHHFSSQNIPFGIASSADHPSPSVVTRIENNVIFLSELTDTILFPAIHHDNEDGGGIPAACLSQPTLNHFAAYPKIHHRKIRRLLQQTFESGSGGGCAGGISAFPKTAVQNISEVEMHLPVHVGDFTDFSCSLDHVQNAGRLVVNNPRPPPAFFNFPIGYEGRGSSVVVSGTEIQRPWGQYRSSSGGDGGGNGSILYRPSAAVDYEVELAAIIGKPLPMRSKLTADEAEEHIFGFVLLNDWSARDIQSLEMIPLGPLNGKNLGTSISPWIITLDALSPFSIPSSPANNKPNPMTEFSFPHVDLPKYLQTSKEKEKDTTYPIQLQVEVLLPPPVDAADENNKASRNILTGTCQYSSLYWNHRHMVSHLVSAGAGLRTGDIVATGTISGGGQGEKGCLLEATEGGKVPLEVEEGKRRKIGYLEDGDGVRITGFVSKEEEKGGGIGFGECVGWVVAAADADDDYDS